MAEASASRPAFEFAETTVRAGTRATIDVPISVLSTHTEMSMPVQIVHGKRNGPVLFVSAAVHGDEVLGVEIIRRIMKHRALRSLRGTLLAVPIVNVFGLIAHSRYLPDRRDLNRSFPGKERGSLASMLADLFLREIVCRSDIGIDLHTAALHRTNLPQIRISNRSEQAAELATAFGAPVVLRSNPRQGSLRQAAADEGVEVLVFEGGEALRFDELSIRSGMMGILRVMQALKMLRPKTVKPLKAQPFVASTSQWVRAPQGGIFRAHRQSGDVVGEGDMLGVVSDPIGENECIVAATLSGIIIGNTKLPIVNSGDALFHIAKIAGHSEAEEKLESMAAELGTDADWDDDEII